MTGRCGCLWRIRVSFLEEERPGTAPKRRGATDEVASVITFLCSERAGFVNGSDYRVYSGSVLAV